MKCSDFNRLLVDSKQSPMPQLPEQAKDHLLACVGCQEFMRAFNLPTAAELPSPELLRQLEQNVTADMRPVLPLAPRRYFFAAFVSTFV